MKGHGMGMAHDDGKQHVDLRGSKDEGLAEALRHLMSPVPTSRDVGVLTQASDPAPCSAHLDEVR